MMESKTSEDKLKQQFINVCTKPNLYSSEIKLVTLVYTPLIVSFLKTLVTNFRFLKIFKHQERKVTRFFQSQLEVSCSYIFYQYIK